MRVIFVISIFILVMVSVTSCTTQIPASISPAATSTLTISQESVTSSPAPTTSLPTPQIPLEGKIVLGIIEKNGSFSISMRTEKMYGYGNLLKYDLKPNNSKSFRIDISYIYCPTWPTAPPATGPATNVVNLEKISGQYDIYFCYKDLIDSYQITFNDSEIRINAINNQFTSLIHEVWQRLPADTIWFNTFSVEPPVIKTPGLNYMDKQAYQSYVNDFFSQIESFGAKRVMPLSGFYPYFGFIPPWPDKQIPQGDSVKITDPDEPRAFWCMKWLDIRFYHYSGQIEDIVRFIESKYARQTTQMWVDFYNTEKRLYPYKY
jgi:hypothetical protein